jgi:hypothetical protein
MLRTSCITVNSVHGSLNGLVPNDENYNPSDVQRVTQIFKKPQFFVDGVRQVIYVVGWWTLINRQADSGDLVQGQIGDCWFISALATMSTARGLVEKFCVAVGHFLVISHYRS